MASNPTVTAHPGLVAPFTKEDLRQAVLEIYLLQLRTMSLLAKDAQLWALAGKSPRSGLSLWNPDHTPNDLGLSYADVADTALAATLEQHYEFAFFGVITPGFEPMEYETLHTWVAAFLMDLSVSCVVQEWESYGVAYKQHIQRCLHACELANARLALEGREIFSYFSRSKADEATAVDALTVRQIALLSGMEEMSVRTAASRKGPNQLPTYKEDGRTLVKVEDAKAWLKAKGRYVEVTHRGDGSALQLEQARFGTLQDLVNALHVHLQHISSNAAARQGMVARLSDLCEAHGFGYAFELTREHTRDQALLRKMAPILGLPEDLFVLRAQQAALSEELAEVDQAIRAIAINH